MMNQSLAKNGTSYQKGILSEKKSMSFLQRYGYKILNNRYKCPYGEIDLVCMKDKDLVIVEVKQRKNPPSAFDDIVSHRQKNRIKQATLHYLSEHPELDDVNISFDVIFNCGSNDLQHYKNVWQID